MRFLRGTLFGVIVLAAALMAVIFTGAVEVREVRVQGINDSIAQRVEDVVHVWLDERTIGVQRGALLPLVRTTLLAEMIGDVLPEVTNINVAIDVPHTLYITADERLPDGIWCQGDICRFWDRSETLWGSTVPSVGPLLLLIRDERTDPLEDDELLPGILATVDGLGPLGLQATYVVLPDAEPGGIRVPTNRGWDLLIDAAGDVEGQLHTLDVFLAEQASDSTFAPLYIDLRTPGRVYYR